MKFISSVFFTLFASQSQCSKSIPSSICMNDLQEENENMSKFLMCTSQKDGWKHSLNN